MACPRPFLVICAVCLILPASHTGATPPDPTDLVNPFIGTGGMSILPPGSRIPYNEIDPHKLTPTPFGGLTYPGAVLPHGMVALSPDQADEGFGWSGGYHHSDSTILGFSHMHTSGNGAGFGYILLVPTTGPVQLQPGDKDHPETGYRSRFSHQNEEATPGYYRVFLEDHQIDAALTATVHAGFHKYTFPGTAPAHVIIDLVHALGRGRRVREASLAVTGPDTISGSRLSENGKGPIFFAAQFSRPFTGFGLALDDKVLAGARQVSGKQIKGHFDFDTTQDRTVLVKVGLSPVSAEGALANLRAEIPAWDFEAVRQEARRAWNTTLGKITVEGGTATERRIFYSALYHSQLAPFEWADRDRHYRGADGKVHAGDFTNHTYFSLWDTFRAVHPLATILDPPRVNDFIRSMMAQADQSDGLLPVFAVAGNNSLGMVGMHAMPVIADAFSKDIRTYDAEHLFQLMKDNLQRNVLGLEHYRDSGYVAADQQPRAAAATFDFAYDHWAVAEMARMLGKIHDERTYRLRAQNWLHSFDPQVGFARGRLADGSWRTPFDPRAVSQYQPDEDFVEGNAWQHTFFVPQDVPALMKAMGGSAKFAAKLDALFEDREPLTGSWSADVTGLWGQYAHGNEQSHHIAYLYDWAGQPWKTQQRVRGIMGRFYQDAPDGLCGNDDSGQMSAWYVFSALGFYPVNPAGGGYAMGSPLFSRMTVQLPGDKTFVITAKKNSATNIYVQSARLNGHSLKEPLVPHTSLMAGGSLDLVMGPRPNVHWGTRGMPRTPPGR